MLIKENNNCGVKLPNNNYLTIFWYSKAIGQLSLDDSQNDEPIDNEPASHELNLKWKCLDSHYGQLFQTAPDDTMPTFIRNLQPEGWLRAVFNDVSQFDYLKDGLRFLSNLVVMKGDVESSSVVRMDQLEGSLDTFSQNGVFNGTISSHIPTDFDDEDFSKKAAKFWNNPFTPRFSGAELKVPVTLDKTGKMSPAVGTSFTHFLKYPVAEEDKEARAGLGINEWMCLELSERIGLKTAKHALVELDRNLTPALLVERYDIPENEEDKTLRITQDMCSLGGETVALKGEGSYEKLATIIQNVSTDPQQDLIDFYKRCILTWTIKDEDMHKKNISMLFEYSKEEGKYTNIRLSPSYDITSDITSQDVHHKQCLSIQGKTSRLNRKAFINFATKIGIDETQANDVLDDTIKTIVEEAIHMSKNFPECAQKHDVCKYTADRIATEAIKTAKVFTVKADINGFEKVLARKYSGLTNTDTRLKNPKNKYHTSAM